MHQRSCRLPLLVIGGSALFFVFLKIAIPVQEECYKQKDDLLQEEGLARKKEYFLIVSAVSSNHFMEAKDMIGSAQKYLPTRLIVMYDLGLEENEREELRKFCNVELRRFEFEKYPPHFISWHMYAWKPIIIRKLLTQEADHLFWADASVRFVEDFETSLSKMDKFPIKGHHREFDIIQVTHTGTLRYFNMTRESMQNVVGIDSEMVLFKTSKVMMHILDLWCDCAMHEECIAPQMAILNPCKYNRVKKGSIRYIGCHRFDQSALNIIIVKGYGTEVYKYILDSVIDRSLSVINHPSHKYPVKMCEL